jgi:hypothetical protein
MMMAKIYKSERNFFGKIPVNLQYEVRNFHDETWTFMLLFDQDQ